MTVFDDSQLKDLGKAAADLSCVSGIPMDEAVTRKLSSVQLSEEQVRRVVEHANIAAFRNKHASMQAPHRVVEFDSGPADPSVVWDQLRAQQSFGDDRPPIDLSPSDYAAEPVLKLAAALPEIRFEDELPSEAPEVAAQKLASLLYQLDQAHEILNSDKANAGLSMRECLHALGGAVKSAALEGATYHEILAAWGDLDPQWVEVAARACGLEAEEGKLASHRRLNPEAPVAAIYAEFAKAASEYTLRHDAVMNIEQSMVRTNQALNELVKSAGILDSLRKGISSVTAKVAPKLNQPAMPVVANAAKATGGALATGARRTVKGVGYGAAGLGAGGLALGGYAAYKGVKGVGDVLSGTGKAIGNIGAPDQGPYGGTR